MRRALETNTFKYTMEQQYNKTMRASILYRTDINR